MVRAGDVLGEGGVRVLDLFSGIGGFSLGLERAGMQTTAFCEIDPYCRLVLAKHWPGVPIYEDVTALTGELVRRDVGDIDVICGGFPCQDISFAGAGAGLEGDRSGLWRDMRRLIGELRPRFAIVENVAALLSRGLGDVLGDLAAIGYDAEWHCIPAAAVGAPHRRDRIWIVAYANEERSNMLRVERGHAGLKEPLRDGEARRFKSLDDTNGAGLEKREGIRRNYGERIASSKRTGWWIVEPNVDRVADGVPARVDRLRALGNAVVPQIPELIGRAILAAERESNTNRSQSVTG